jgi:hypothetical protein
MVVEGEATTPTTSTSTHTHTHTHKNFAAIAKERRDLDREASRDGTSLREARLVTYVSDSEQDDCWRICTVLILNSSHLAKLRNAKVQFREMSEMELTRVKWSWSAGLIAALMLMFCGGLVGSPKC